MAQQTINIGATPNDWTGDPLRDAFDKANDNFTELYASLAGLLDLKGDTDCSANPNYPAALKGDAYYVTVAGKIGGASGKPVDVGDLYVAKADNAGGTEASVGTSWFVLEHNLAGVALLTGATFTGDVVVPDEAYDATAWNGSLEVPTKNAVRDKIEALGGGGVSMEEAGTPVSGGPFTTLNFNSGATVVDAGSGVADIDVTGGSSGGSGAGWSAAGMKRQWFGSDAGPQGLGWGSGLNAGTASAVTTATAARLTRANRSVRTTSSASTPLGWLGDSGAPIFRRNSEYIYEGVGGFDVGATIGQKRLFIGMKAVDSFPLAVDPSSLTDIVGLAADTADANWQIMRNDGSGTATKVDTGWAKAVGDLLYVRITANASEIRVYAEHYAAANLTMTPTNVFAEATYTTDIPSGTTEMFPLLWGCTAAAAESTSLSGIYQSILSPF